MADDEARRIHRDLVDFARTTNEDVYELLSLTPPSATESEPLDAAALRKAWRKTALKYHPDKNPGFEALFDLCNKAFQVLSDDEARGVFDGRRRAEQARKEREGKMDEKKREMLRRLQEAENKAKVGVKRGRDGSTETDMERKVRELAAKGRRAREERDERLRKEWEEQEQQRLREQQPKPVVPDSSSVQEDDRTVTVYWLRGTPAGDQVDGPKLQEIFTQFGPVEDVMMLTDRRRRPQKGEKTKHKVEMGTAAVVFQSIVGAHAAVTDAASTVADDTLPLDQVSWLGREAPACIASALKNGYNTGEYPKERSKERGTTTESTQDTKAVPKFSFTPRASSQQSNSPADTGQKSKPSSFELTMIKLREAQRAKEKRRAEEAEAAAEQS